MHISHIQIAGIHKRENIRVAMLTMYNHIHTDTIVKPTVLISHTLKYPKNAKALRPG